MDLFGVPSIHSLSAVIIWSRVFLGVSLSFISTLKNLQVFLLKVRNIFVFFHFFYICYYFLRITNKDGKSFAASFFCLLSCNSSACLKINSFMALGGLLLGSSFTIPHLLCFTSSSLKILLDGKYKSKIIVVIFSWFFTNVHHLLQGMDLFLPFLLVCFRV